MYDSVWSMKYQNISVQTGPYYLYLSIFSYENANFFIFFYYYITWPFLGKEFDLKSINIYYKNNLFKILTSTS